MPEHTPAPTFSRSVYGFVLYFFFQTFFTVYLIWALIPETILNQLNITYFPRKYWAVALPILVLNYIALFAFFIYPGLNLCMVPSIYDTRTFTDQTCSKTNEKGAMRVEEVHKRGLNVARTKNLNKIVFFDKCAGGDEINCRIPNVLSHAIGVSDTCHVNGIHQNDNYYKIHENMEGACTEAPPAYSFRPPDSCTCQSLKTCYKSIYDKKEYFTSKRVQDLSLVLQSIPPVEDLSISDVCYNLYLK